MYRCKRETVIEAPPEKIFNVLANVERHPELAGSKEVLKVRKLTEGPVGVGTKFEADEDIREPKAFKSTFVAQSQVTRFEAPALFEWQSFPPIGPKTVVTWTYSLAPGSGGTRVIERVHVKVANPVVDILMALPYRFMRGKILARGMERTLENLRQMAKA